MFPNFTDFDLNFNDLSQKALTVAVQTRSTTLASWALYYGANPNGRGPTIVSTTETPAKICDDEIISKAARKDPGLVVGLLFGSGDACRNLKSKTEQFLAASYYGLEHRYEYYFGALSKKTWKDGVYVSKLTKTLYIPASSLDASYSYPTLLVHAIKHTQDAKMVNLLVSHGADVDYTRKQHGTALREFVDAEGMDLICKIPTIQLPICVDAYSVWHGACCPPTESISAPATTSTEL